MVHRGESFPVCSFTPVYSAQGLTAAWESFLEEVMQKRVAR